MSCQVKLRARVETENGNAGNWTDAGKDAIEIDSFVWFDNGKWQRFARGSITIAKLGDKGTRTYQCCVDYQGSVVELDEGNDCQTFTFTVK